MPDLKSFRDWADEVLTRVNSSVGAEDPEIGSAAERLREACNELKDAASGNVRVAVIGEFNSGKSMLLGCLVGYAGVLPVSGIPTTGNITELHIEPSSSLALTQVRSWEVDFLRDHEFRDILKHLQKKATEYARNTGLEPATVRRAEELNENGATLGVELRDWAKSIWPLSANPELRYVLLEIKLIVDCWLACGTALAGETFTVSESTAKEGMKIPGVDIHVKSLQNLPGPASLSRRPDTLDVPLLKSVFPLIRRIRLRLDVPTEVWDVSAFASTAKLVLMDFPGLGASSSGVRDEYLCQNELATLPTPTLLLALNGANPGSGEALKIRTRLEQLLRNALLPGGVPAPDLQNHLLVVISRFDQIEISNAEHQMLFGQGPVSFDEKGESGASFHTISRLNKALNDAKSLLPQLDQITFASGFVHALKANDARLTLSQEVKEELVGKTQGAEQARKSWEALLPILTPSQKGHPNQPLIASLRGFSADGGMRHLRSCVENHVLLHGVRFLYQQVQGYANKVELARAELAGKIHAVRDQRLAELDPRSALRRLYSDFTASRKSWESDPPTLKVIEDSEAISLTEWLECETTAHVFSWPCWKSLYDGSKQQKRGISQTELELFGEEEESTAVPVATLCYDNSESFFPFFQHCLEDIKKKLRPEVENAIRQELAALGAKLQVSTKDLERLVSPEELRQRIITAGRARSEWRGPVSRLFDVLKLAGDTPAAAGGLAIGPSAPESAKPQAAESVEPRPTVATESWVKEINKHFEEPSGWDPEALARRYFPFRTPRTPGESGTKLPWAGREFPELQLHATINRVRTEIAKSATLATVSHAVRLREAFWKAAHATVKSCNDALSETVGDAELLAVLAGKDPRKSRPKLHFEEPDRPAPWSHDDKSEFLSGE